MRYLTFSCFFISLAPNKPDIPINVPKAGCLRKKAIRSFNSNLILIFILITFAQNGFSQIVKDLGLEFSSSNTKKLEKLEIAYEEVNNKIKDVVSFYESIPVNDTVLTKSEIDAKLSEAGKMLKQVSREYQALTKQVYDVYRETAREFWETQRKDGHMPTGLQKAKYLEREARNSLSQSSIKREIVDREFSFTAALKKLNEANSLEVLALLHEARALRIYQDFPVEYDYDWKNDINLDEILVAERIAKEERNEKLFEAHKKEVVEDTTKEEEVVIETEEKEPVTIEFRVQVAAHTIPLTEEYINTIYKGNKQVNEIVEDNWYKYQIGSYSSYAQAEKILQEVNVERAFIVAYKNSQKCNVTDVKDLAP